MTQRSKVDDLKGFGTATVANGDSGDGDVMDVDSDAENK